MKAKAFQIHWHNKQPIYSVDFHPQNSNKLATCGGDNNVRIWSVIHNDCKETSNEESLLGSGLKVEYLATLTKHMKSVNCVRFSPSGEYLASAGDGGFVILWKQSDTPPLKFNKAFGDDSEDEEADADRKEFWNVVHQFRAMDGEDVYDLAWNPDSKSIILGLTDNTAQIWDTQQAKCIKVLKDHQHFVQGVAWDPLNQFLVTQSSDRSAKIWTMRSNVKGGINYYSLAKYSKMSIEDSTQQSPSSYSIFHDETLVSFFRRPSFSPDGSILCLPTGQRTPLTSKSTQHGVYLNLRNNLHKTPSAYIGGFEKAAIAIRFNPRFFPLISDGPEPFVCLPYRMIFALITQNSVYIYDTQNLSPLFMFANLHYASLTDVSWSSDGIKLVASSVDGFCTVAEFDAKIDFGGEALSPEDEETILKNVFDTAKSVPFFNLPLTNHQKKQSLLNNPIPLSSDIDIIIEREVYSSDSEPEPEAGAEPEVETENNKEIIIVEDENVNTSIATDKINQVLHPSAAAIIHNPPVKRRITPTLLSKD